MNATEAGKILARKRQNRRTKKSDVSKAAAFIGRLGGVKGGKARAAKLSPAERKRIALVAAKAAGKSHKKRAALLKRFRESL